jgi:hypothetical protein
VSKSRSTTVVGIPPMPCVDTRSLGNTRSCICICAGCWASTCPGVSSNRQGSRPATQITGPIRACGWSAGRPPVDGVSGADEGSALNQ